MKNFFICVGYYYFIFLLFLAALNRRLLLTACLSLVSDALVGNKATSNFVPVTFCTWKLCLHFVAVALTVTRQQ